MKKGLVRKITLYLLVFTCIFSNFGLIHADSVNTDTPNIEDYFEFLKPSDDYKLYRKDEITLDEAIKDYENSIKEFDTEVLEKLSADQVNEKVDKVLDAEIKFMDNLDSFESKNITIQSDYDENKWKLRQGNLIELTLNIDEGLSNSEIARILSHASTAKKISANEYPSNADLQDALRHFSWNFLGVNDSRLGTYKTRTATINHEWGRMLIDVVVKKYDEKYNEYRRAGQSERSAASNALADAIIFIPYIKYNTVRVCQSSYDFFRGIFSDDDIMDLHNNCYGRAYASNYPSYTALSAFNLSRQRGELILSSRNVTSNQARNVWASEWYTY